MPPTPFVDQQPDRCWQGSFSTRTNAQLGRREQLSVPDFNFCELTIFVCSEHYPAPWDGILGESAEFASCHSGSRLWPTD
jgi:hypothetical protein